MGTMDREPNSFDWGLGSSGQSAGQPSLAQRLQSSAQENEADWSGVSYNPGDLGFEEQEIPRKSLARRVIPPIIVLSIIGGLLAVATVGADRFARSAVAGVIQGKVAETLKVAEDDVIVDLGGGVFIGQAVSGSIDDVTVRVPEATLNGLVGAVSLSATGVPTDQTEPDTLAVAMTLEGERAKEFAKQLRPNSKTRVLLRDGVIAVTRNLPAGAIIVFYIPTVVDGSIVLTPDSVRVNKKDMTVDEFVGSKFGAAGESLVVQRTVCIDDKIPEKLSLTSITVAVDSFTLEASGEKVPLSTAGLTTLGSCEKE